MESAFQQNAPIDLSKCTDVKCWDRGLRCWRHLLKGHAFHGHTPCGSPARASAEKTPLRCHGQPPDRLVQHVAAFKLRLHRTQQPIKKSPNNVFAFDAVARLSLAVVGSFGMGQRHIFLEMQVNRVLQFGRATAGEGAARVGHKAGILRGGIRGRSNEMDPYVFPGHGEPYTGAPRLERGHLAPRPSSASRDFLICHCDADTVRACQSRPREGFGLVLGQPIQNGLPDLAPQVKQGG